MKKIKDNLPNFLDYIFSFSKESYLRGTNNLYWFSLVRYKIKEKIILIVKKNIVVIIRYLNSKKLQEIFLKNSIN